MNIVGKQRELLKKFKESDEFFSRVGLSQSNIYFKIQKHKFTALNKSTRTSSYFNSNFKLIKCVRQMQRYFVKKSKNICFIIFHSFSDNFVCSGGFYTWRIISSVETFI